MAGAGGGAKPIWNFDPRSVPGCALWYDSADRSTLTLVGSNVTQWNDKSANGLHLSNASGGATYTSSGLTFSGTTLLSNSTGYNSSIGANLFVVWSSPTGGTRQRMFVLQFNGGYIGGLVDTTYMNNLYSSTLGNYVGPLSFSANTPYLYSINIATPSVISYTVNGSNSTTWSASQVGPFNSTILSAGGGSTVEFNGKIMEILYYDALMSTVQRQQVEGYLAWKWGIAVRKIPAPAFVPTSISGCAIWLDASDAATVTLSGSNVTQWSDKSGNGRNLPAVSGYANATVSSGYQAGRNVLNFSGNGLYRTAGNSAVYPQDVYIIVAVKSTTTHVDVLGMGPTDADNFNSLTFGEAVQSRWQNGSSYGARNVISASNETSTRFLLIQWSLANNNFLVRRNGIQLAQSSAPTYTLPNGSVFQIGFRHTNLNQANFSGYIGEIVVFNSQLGATQCLQVENYLISKWNIQLETTLPSTHPFYSIRPYQRAFQPTDIDGCVLWLDGSDRSTFTFSSGSNIASIKDKAYGTVATTFSNSVASAVHSGGTIVSGTREKGSVTLLAGNGLQIESVSMTPTMTVFYVSYASGATSVPTIEWSADSTVNPGFLLSTRSGSNFILNAGITYSNFLMTTFFANTGSIPDRSGPTLAGGNNSGWGAVIQAGQALNPINFGNNLSFQPAGAYNYSALTTGFVYSASVGTIQFQGTTDDGLVVRFNGVDVLNQYQQQGATTYYSGSLVLPAGYTPIRIIWYDTGGGGQYQISFSINGGAYTNNGTGVFYSLSSATY
jgi:hypothetical protein